MPDVIACYKWVVDEADIRIAGDLVVDLSHAQMKISDYDRNAIEAAVQVAAALGGKAVGLTLAGDKAKRSIKDALSRGLDEMLWINSGDETADNAATAEVLAVALGSLENVSLVLTSEGASDDFSRQTAPRMAAILDWPVVTCARSININGNTAIISRRLENYLETVEVDLPVVVSVLPEIATAPIPGMKAVIAAGKKPNKEIRISDLGINISPKVVLEKIEGFKSNRKNVIFDASDENAIGDLVAALRKEGVL
jgi:electron transfer flavoprotein beta subunit